MSRAAADQVCKLILLGNGSVGKSSIIARFTDDGFQRVYKQTVGLDFFEKLVTIRGTRRLKLQVWDIGGQSVGSRMLPKYIYGAHVIFLCYDVTDPTSFRDLEDWLRLARRVVGGGPGVGGAPAPPPSLAGRPRAKLYAVGNKLDLEHLRKVTKLQHDAFVREHRLAGGHLVSAQSGQNVLTSFYKTAAELAGIKLTAHEIEFTKKVLEVNVVAGDDDARTAIADQIEAEDRAAEEARRKRENRRFPRCVCM